MSIKTRTVIVSDTDMYYAYFGSGDHTVGIDAPYELNEMIPNSKLYIYEGLGHGAFEEAAYFYDRVFDFTT